MKNIKLLYGLGAFVFASSLISCEKDQLMSSSFSNQENAIVVEPAEVRLKLVDLPAPIKTDLEKNYAGFVFLEAKKSTSTAGVNIFTIKFLLKFIPYEVSYDASGKVLSTKKAGISEFALKESELPTDITSYLKANFAGYKFVSAKKYEVDKKPFFEIKIVNSAGGIVELKFDGTGKILITNSNGQTTIVVKESELLPSITTYLKTKYPNFTFVSAKKVSKSGVIYYELKIKVGANTYEMKFNANGTIVESSDQSVKNTPLTATTLPAAVLEYLKANYAGYVFISGEKSEKATGTYLNIKIKQNNVTFELKFDANGAFQSMAGSNKTTEIKINLTDLPANATTYLRATFAQMVLVSARKVTKNESVTYVVKLKAGNKEYIVIFDSSGKMLSNKRA